jgi:hypothetical protein
MVHTNRRMSLVIYSQRYPHQIDGLWWTILDVSRHDHAECKAGRAFLEGGLDQLGTCWTIVRRTPPPPKIPHTKSQFLASEQLPCFANSSWVRASSSTSTKIDIRQVLLTAYCAVAPLEAKRVGVMRKRRWRCNSSSATRPSLIRLLDNYDRQKNEVAAPELILHMPSSQDSDLHHSPSKTGARRLARIRTYCFHLVLMMRVR